MVAHTIITAFVNAQLLGVFGCT